MHCAHCSAPELHAEKSSHDCGGEYVNKIFLSKHKRTLALAVQARKSPVEKTFRAALTPARAASGKLFIIRSVYTHAHKMHFFNDHFPLSSGANTCHNYLQSVHASRVYLFAFQVYAMTLVAS
jgi:hypothetical protein